MSRCPECPNRHQCIPADGPCERRGLLLIGEAPGPVEEREAVKRPPGRPFVGKTGEEVNRHYLPLAGLRRESVTFVNAIQCFPSTSGGKLDPSAPKDIALLEGCAAHHLYPLIQRMQPRMIVAMGRFACMAVDPSIELEKQHGIPVAESEFGCPIFPMYHPALGLHTPKQMLYIRTDWDRLRRYMKGQLLIPVDDYAGQEDYAEVTDVRELDDLDPTIPLGGDTESSLQLGPFCLTYSQYPGTGRLIRAERTDLIEAFQRKVERWESIILFHNWLYDWAEVEQMGVRFPHKRVVDTMMIVYHLGNMPQGLKALAFRELGMQMQDFDDLVRPHSTRRALEYLKAAQEHDWPKPDPEMVRGDDGRWKAYRPQGLSTKLKRFFTDYAKKPDMNVFERWTNWESVHAEIEEVIGPWPGMDIRHAPFDEVLHYACRDSDTLVRLWPILKRMQRLVRRFGQERWRERAA